MNQINTITTIGNSIFAGQDAVFRLHLWALGWSARAKAQLLEMLSPQGAARLGWGWVSKPVNVEPRWGEGALQTWQYPCSSGARSPSQTTVPPAGGALGPEAHDRRPRRESAWRGPGRQDSRFKTAHLRFGCFMTLWAWSECLPFTPSTCGISAAHSDDKPRNG